MKKLASLLTDERLTNLCPPMLVVVSSLTNTWILLLVPADLGYQYWFSDLQYDRFWLCSCDYILFTMLPWPGDSEGTFRSSSQTTICPPVYHTRRRLHTVSFIPERQAGKLWIPIFIVSCLTRPGIELEFTWLQISYYSLAKSITKAGLTLIQ